ncbi:uncharacterized protein LA080_010029 [Diaporthe eres]|nr:uncharacterized protein LA080_010029 [Diaporthe eres]
MPNSSSPRGAANLITNSMTITETDETCESQLIVERTVPAKYVLDPKLLTTELERLFGEGKFAVEMRHNCYQIKTSKEFKLVLSQSSEDTFKCIQSLKLQAANRFRKKDVEALKISTPDAF